MPPSTGRTPTINDLREAYTVFERRLTTAFGVYAWTSQVVNRLKDPSEIPSYVRMAENAIVTGTLVCIRALDDFFLLPKQARHDHDIIAHHFGFQVLGSTLGDAERIRINRLIVHMSYAPIWEGSEYAGPNLDGSFDIRELLSRLVPRCLEFMDFISRGTLFTDEQFLGHVRKLRDILRCALGNLQALAQMERSNHRAT